MPTWKIIPIYLSIVLTSIVQVHAQSGTQLNTYNLNENGLPKSELETCLLDKENCMNRQ